jgi:hypothetical protein
MKYLLIFSLLTGLCAVSCQKYQTQYEGPYADPKDGEVPTFMIKYEILTLQNGVIQLYTADCSQEKILSNLPGGIEKASINYSHDQIAYQIPGEDIQIIDTSGQFIATVPGSDFADWFDWHTNNKTLYYLKWDQLNTYGPDIPGLADQNFNWVFPFGSSDQTVNCAAVLENGNVLLGCRYYGAFEYVNRILLITSTGLSKSQTLPSYELVKWIRSDISGKRIYFGTSNGFNGSVFELNAQQWSITEDEYSIYAAPSPEGNAKVGWYNGLGVSFDTGDYFSPASSTPNLKALDW